MKDNAGSISESRGSHRLGQSLVILQVAASLILMIGAGLFVRTLTNFENKNLGFNQKNLLLFGLDPTRAGYQGPRLLNFFQQLLPRIQSLPGVQSATATGFIPLSGWSNNTNITVVGSNRKITDNHLRWNTVGPDFFRTTGIPIILGRGITEADVATSPHVAVVDQTFVHKYLGDANPLGQHFYLGASTPNPDFTFTIVGVVKPAELTNIHAEPVAKAYMAYAQFPQFLSALYFFVRTPGNPTGLLPEIRDAVRQMDPNLPLMNVSTQTELTAEALDQERLFARLSSFFGLLALVLASIGLYGTMAYSVARKTHEIGIRMALGANSLGVLRMLLAQGMKLTLIGVAIGIAGALAATRLISSMIYGVTATDPLTFCSVAACLIFVALLACYIPARRAMRTDPMVALRYE
jgi:predicted permease